MDDQTSKINKIVANELIKNQAIFLPSLGSLWVETLSSKFNSSSAEIIPPRYIVKFSSQQKGHSIIEIIANVAECTPHNAGVMYSEWLESVATPNGANIEEVGAVVNNKFNIASTLDKLLNPEAQRVIQLKRSRGRWIWIVASVAVCVLVGLVANFSIQWYLSLPKEPKVAQVVTPVVQEPIAEQIIEPDTTAQLTCTAAPEVVENPRYRVVYGVFSTPENAQKGAELAHQASQLVVASVRPFGDKYMVSIFGSDDITDAKAFIERYSSTYADLWIYKRRGE